MRDWDGDGDGEEGGEGREESCEAHLAYVFPSCLYLIGM